MRYVYFPGCSLESSARQYDESVRWVFKRLGAELIDLPDWNCCGATQYMSVKETVSVTISARNLALAEPFGADILAPCSSCFMTLKKTNEILRSNPIIKAKVDQALKAAGLSYKLSVRVRHPLDVLINDFGVDKIAEKAVCTLGGLKVAPYYGCQIVRIKDGFDDQEVPMTLEKLLAALGAQVVELPVKTRCCGGTLMTTYESVGLKLNNEILHCAIENGADCIATTCPLCQINLECYQKDISKTFGTAVRIPVLFFTQLLGLALGSGLKDVGLQRHVVSPGKKILEIVRG